MQNNLYVLRQNVTHNIKAYKFMGHEFAIN